MPKNRRSLVLWLCCVCWTFCGASLWAQQAVLLTKELPLEGEIFGARGRPAFLIPGRAGPPRSGKSWGWYAPTLPNLPRPEERWMFERFAAAGVTVAGITATGIDGGESYGSPRGNTVYTALYEAMKARSDEAAM